MGTRSQKMMIGGIALTIAGALSACGNKFGLPPRPMTGSTAAPVDAAYIVARGDTVYSIAKRHGHTANQWIAENGLQPPYVIYPGQMLRRPGLNMPVAAAQMASRGISPEARPGPELAPLPQKPVLAKASSPTTSSGQPEVTRESLSPVAMGTMSTPIIAYRTSAATTGSATNSPPPVPMASAAAPKPVAPSVSIDPASLSAGEGNAETGDLGGNKGDPVAAVLASLGEGTSPSSPAMAAATAAPTLEAPASEQQADGPQSLDLTAEVTPAAAPSGEGGVTSAAENPSQMASLPAAEEPEVIEPLGTDGKRFLWPVEGPILSAFGPKEGGLHNDGINISAPSGTPVKATEAGTVIYTGNEVRGFGNLILIRHRDGWVSAYAHAERILVQRGHNVRRGQTIALVGASGKAPKPQLHFELRQERRPVNPLQYLPNQSASRDLTTAQAVPRPPG